MAIYRLDKYLSDAGLGTRTEVKQFIKKGLVTVNTTIAKRPEQKINTDTDTIRFQNEEIKYSEYEYYLLNKPAGYVSATKDNTAPTVISLIESNHTDLFPVGRLDKDTEGLLLITNDGTLSHKLLTPKRHVDKVYYAIVEGLVDESDILAFKNGLNIGDEDLDIALPSKLEVLRYEQENNLSYIEVTLHEGKFHQVKRMFQAVGKNVSYLKRIRFGTLSLPEDMETGSYRLLTESELTKLNSL